MKTRTLILASVSMLSLAVIPSAMAEGQVKHQSQSETNVNAQGQKSVAENLWEDTKDVTSNAYQETKDAAGNAYQKTKSTVKKVMNSDNESQMTYSSTTAASFYLGRDVTNQDGNTIASIHDILLDKDGNASYAVLRNGGVMGMGGNLVLIDFSTLENGQINANSGIDFDTQPEIRASLTEDDLDRAKEYNESQYSEYTSVDDLMDGRVMDSNNNILSYVSEVVIENNKAKGVILSTLEDRTDKDNHYIAMDFDAVGDKFQKNGSETNIHLSKSKSQNFKMALDNLKSKS